jgi:hypothetical protein
MNEQKAFIENGRKADSKISVLWWKIPAPVRLFCLVSILAVVTVNITSAVRDYKAKVKAQEYEVATRAAEKLPSLFKDWKSDEVQDGTIQQWRGNTSELLFIQRAQCGGGFFEPKKTPCWFVHARTKAQQLFYLDAYLDEETKTVRLGDVPHIMSTDAVIKAAIEENRPDVLQKIGVKYKDM